MERRATPAVAVGQICPPCDSTIDLLIAKSMPPPCGLVVNKALKISSAVPAGDPTPVSLTEISTCPYSSRFRLGCEHSAGLLHRLDAIEHQVHQYLLQLHPVRRDFGKTGGKVVRIEMAYSLASPRSSRTISPILD